MKKTDDRNEYESICVNCAHSVNIRESNLCICYFNGAMRSDARCRRFELDLLKLSPMPRALPEDGQTTVLDM